MRRCGAQPLHTGDIRPGCTSAIGAVVISYDSTLLLRLVDEGRVGTHLIGIVTTLWPAGYGPAGTVANDAASLYGEVGALLAPDDSAATT